MKRRTESASESYFNMIDIPSSFDRMKLTSTFSFGSADLPMPSLTNQQIIDVAATFIKNIMRLKVMMAVSWFFRHDTAHNAAGRIWNHGVTIKEKKWDAAIASQIFARFKQLYHTHNMEIQGIKHDAEQVEKFATDSLEKGAAVTLVIASADSATIAFQYAFMSYLIGMDDVWDHVRRFVGSSP
jgi:hypothetical protein